MAALGEVVREDWYDIMWHEDHLIFELVKTGEAGKRVLLDELQQAPNALVEDAANYLGSYRAIDPLLEILAEDDVALKRAALTGLFYQLGHDLTREEHEKLEEKLTPLLRHEHPEVRTLARMILVKLERNPPVSVDPQPD